MAVCGSAVAIARSPMCARPAWCFGCSPMGDPIPMGLLPWRSVPGRKLERWPSTVDHPDDVCIDDTSRRVAGGQGRVWGSVPCARHFVVGFLVLERCVDLR